MTVLDLAKVYCRRVGGSPGYLEQLTVFVRRLGWKVSDLTPDKIDSYLDDALTHLAPSTCHNHRRMAGTLMRFAAQEGMVDKSIVRPLRRVKVPPPNPVALSHEQIAHWVRTAENMRGGGKKCAYKILLPAWILAAYSTGLRTGDLLAIKYDQVRGHRLLLRQNKTAEPHVAWLDDSALAAIHRLPKLGPRIFGDLTNKDRILHAMRRLVKLDCQEGTTRTLRKSGATYCEAAGRDASKHLGHRDPGMKKRYVDRALLAELTGQGPTAPPIPMPLLEGGASDGRRCA